MDRATIRQRKTGQPVRFELTGAVQLLLGHSKIESTVRYLGIEVDDAIETAEKIDICGLDAISQWADVAGDVLRVADRVGIEIRFCIQSPIVMGAHFIVADGRSCADPMGQAARRLHPSTLLN